MSLNMSWASSRATKLAVSSRVARVLYHRHDRRLSSLTQRSTTLLVPVPGLRSPCAIRQFSLWPSKVKPPSTPAVSDPALADLESDTGETAASSVTDEAIADPDAAPDSFASDDAVSFSDDVVSSDALDAVVSNVPAAMQYGDLAALGLTGWTPAGLVRWGLEALHVSTGLPWFHTIVVASILARLAVAPLNVMSTRDSARIAPFQPRLTAIAQELRAASVKRDPHAIRRAQEAQRAVFKAADVNPVRLTLVGLSGFLFQLPLSFGIFFGLKKLCELPLEGLKHSGFALVPDLTVVDPTYMLPLTAAALISFQTKLVVPDLVASGNMTLAHAMNFLRVAVFPLSFVMATLPSGIIVSIITSVVCYTVQLATLRIPAIRHLFGLPILDASKRQAPTLMDTARHIKAYLRAQGSGPPKRGPTTRALPPRRR